MVENNKDQNVFSFKGSFQNNEENEQIPIFPILQKKTECIEYENIND